MGRAWLVLALVTGCGQVNKVRPDARAGSDQMDARPIDALACTGSDMMLCDQQCIDTSSDDNHCGTCTTSCSAQQGCFQSSCIDATASCQAILELDPGAQSGPYTHVADGSQFYCDMTKGLNGGPPPIQYDRLAMGQYNASYPGYSIIDASVLGDAGAQQAFVFLFDRDGGIPALATWTATNVCITTTAAGGTRLTFGNSLLFPGQAGMTVAAYTANALYTPALVNLTPELFPAPPLPATFFQSYPPSSEANCADGANPALFFQRH
ncbi:MAG TPA: hypothetical protein VLX92_23260 [Kofleriaceae bacterium]|nr:hypothetical protein [Kofleriaceae bacterium]